MCSLLTCFSLHWHPGGSSLAMDKASLGAPAVLALLGAIPFSCLVLLFLKHAADGQQSDMQKRILELQKEGFSRTEIARKLDLRREVLYRCVAGTQAAFKHSSISDSDLIAEIASIKQLLPGVGAKRVQGALLE